MPNVCNVLSRTYGLVIGVLSIILCLWGLWKAYSIRSEENSSIKISKTVVEAAAVGCLINVFASVLLLLGIVAQRHRLLWPWLINNGLFIFLGSIGLVIQPAEYIPRCVGGLFLLCFLYFLMYLVYEEIQGSIGGGYSRPRVVAMQSQTMNIY
nr:uncharacterized protein LOC108082280 [Drosophila kikkawai]